MKASTFENFQQRTTASGGVESKSTTEYKGYKIVLRAYTMSGISYKILKTKGSKMINLRQQNWSFHNPHELLQKAKNYIDEYTERLDDKFKKLSNP